MQTPETLNQLGDDEIRAVLETLASTHFETSQWKTPLAEATGYSYEAVKNWYRPGKRPPVIVIMWVEAEMKRKAYEDMLGSLGRIVNLARDLA